MVMENLPFRCGYSFGKSSLQRSESSADSSTPVGPPPMTAICSRFRCSCSEIPGREASSSNCLIRAWTRFASATFRTKKACSSAPDVLKVFVMHLLPLACTYMSRVEAQYPGASTRRSYGTSNCLGSSPFRPCSARHLQIFFSKSMFSTRA